MKFKLFILSTVFLSTLLLSSFNEAKPVKSKDGTFVVVLDAGHGGHDPGNLGNGYFEKNIALNIVLKIGKILEQDPNIKVIYTRKDDTFVDLYVRGEIANKANADLFVSVHCDSHSSNAHGAGTFVLGLHANKQNFEIAKKENSVIYLEDNYENRYANYDINSPESVIGLTIMQEEFLDQSIKLAKGIQDNFSNKLKRNNRKVKQAGFIVLHQTFMPSVLVETGFLTNSEEGAYLNSKNGQSEMGVAIAQAILEYKNGVPSRTSNEPLKPILNETPEIIAEASKKTVPISEEVTNAQDEVVTKPNTEGIVDSSVPDKMVEEVKTETQMPDKPVAEISKPKEEEMKEVVKKTVKEVSTATVPDKPKEAVLVVQKKVEAPKEVVVAPKKAENITFKVQILASTKDIALKSSNFRGLNKLSQEPYKNLQRYMYGSVGSMKEAELLKANADVKGYVTSFIVAYKDGKRIPIKEAMKYVSDK